MYNLSQFCRNGSLVVSPRKGTMVLWYNHLLNEEGYLGVLDPYSLHGGCDVLEGEKWIANNWIPAPETPNQIFKNIYKPNYVPNPVNDPVSEDKSEVLSKTSDTAVSDEL
ncbi:hypothetical protein MXB_2912 [Myxobolus squamalis]|nr:hypothetical protein MXB_2912 [Myxobolus squamalis]